MLQFNTKPRTQELLVRILININILPLLLLSTLLIVHIEILVLRCICRFPFNETQVIIMIYSSKMLT